MIRINSLVYASAVLAVALLGIAFLTHTAPVHGEVNFSQKADSESYQTYNFFTATTTSATSTNLTGGGGYMIVAGAHDVIFYFGRGDTRGTGNSGSSRFNVQVSPDGTNWYDYNELGQVTISQDANSFFVRQGTTTIAAATSTTMWAMEDNSYYAVRCITVRVTDGEATCRASATF